MHSKVGSVIGATLAAAFLNIGCESYSLPSDLAGLTAAMESSDMGIQAAAAEKIDKQFGKQGLVTALRDGGPGARAQTARRLSRFDDRDVVQALIPVAQSDPNRQVRFSAISALGLIGDQEARPVLTKMAEDSDPLVRAGVQHALRDMDAKAK